MGDVRPEIHTTEVRTSLQRSIVEQRIALYDSLSTSTQARDVLHSYQAYEHVLPTNRFISKIRNLVRRSASQVCGDDSTMRPADQKYGYLRPTKLTTGMALDLDD
jgi:hypothetical protein